MLLNSTWMKTHASQSSSLDTSILKALKRINAKSISIAVKINNDYYTFSHGDFQQGRPYALASLSKPVTAFILQRMEQDRMLQLKDPIRFHDAQLKTIKNADKILDNSLFSFMTHQFGLASLSSYKFKDWKERLTEALSKDIKPGHAYANDNYTLLTRVIINKLGSYQSGIDKYINVDGLSTFRIGRYHGIPSYAGVGELEASALDYLKFMEKAAPLSEEQSNRFGIGWFHHPKGDRYHTGAHNFGKGRRHFACAVWNLTAKSGRRISFVVQTDEFDLKNEILKQLRNDL